MERTLLVTLPQSLRRSKQENVGLQGLNFGDEVDTTGLN